MYYSHIKVEQINEKFDVVEDYGEILNRKEMIRVFEKYFPLSEHRNGCLYGTYGVNRFCIYFKNISYLGTPHPSFKKRIQIGDTFKDIYAENTRLGIRTLLIGVYQYKSTVLFVDFDVTKYVARKAHHSSAHVYTLDLKNGLLFGIFRKEDTNGNLITVVAPSEVDRFLRSKFDSNVDLRLDFIAILDDFFAGLPKHWHGIAAYREMANAKFNHTGQPEWPGFYLEYKLAEYIKEHGVENTIQYVQKKKKGEIDLDLVFPTSGNYGDLKAHSNDSSGIQGNDRDTVLSVLKNSSIYYVVCNHDTEKDKDHEFEVTTFWNKLHKKDNLMSYSDKMKHSVKLTSYSVLEINRFNSCYLDVFRQGHNSDGSPRAPKISIKKKNINNFLIHQLNF